MTIQKYILSFFVFLITVVAAFSQETTTITDVVDKTLIDKHFPEQKLSEPQKEIDDNTERIVLRWYLKNACNNSATYLQQSVPETPFNPNRAVIFSDIVRKGKSSPFCNAKPIVCCCNCTMVYLSPCCYKPARFTGLSLRFIYRKSFISFGHTGFRNNPNNVGTLCSPQPCGQQNEKPKDQKDGQKDRKKPEDQGEDSGDLDTSPDFYITDDIITQEWIDERWFKIKLPKTKEKIDKFCEYINNNKSIDDNSIIESNIFYRLPKYEEWKEKVTNNNKDNRWPDFTKTGLKVLEEQVKDIWRKIIQDYNVMIKDMDIKELPENASLNDVSLEKVLGFARGDTQEDIIPIIDIYFKIPEDHKEIGQNFYYDTSRAKKGLFIIDDQVSIIKLWCIRDQDKTVDGEKMALQFTQPNDANEEWSFRLAVKIDLSGSLKNNWFLDIVRKNRKDTDKLEKYTSQIKKLTKITEKEKIKAVKVADNVIKVYQGNIPDELKETDKFFKYYVAVKDNVP